MSDAKVRVETRELPSGDGRQISARRYSSADLSDREDDLRAAIHSVLTTMVRAVEDTPVSPLRVGGLEVAFNVASRRATEPICAPRPWTARSRSNSR